MSRKRKETMAIKTTRYQEFKLSLFLLSVSALSGYLLLLNFWPVHAQDTPTAPAALVAKPSLTQSVFMKGKAVYEKQCAVCHGANGAGDGAASFLLYPKPRDLARGEFRLVSTSSMEATDEDLFKTISRGMPGSAMPSWEFLPAEERWGLVYYVRYLANLGKKKARGELTEETILAGLSWDAQKELASTQISPEAMIHVPPEIPPTPERIAVGKELFAKACAPCHGPLGKGDGKMQMMDNLGYPLRPRDLTAGIFKGYFDYENLYYRIAAGLPGSPMPGYKDALTADQIQDLIHYIQTLPDRGAEELARVKRHRIVAAKTVEAVEFDPHAGIWLSMDPVYVALTPLWWRDHPIEGVEVRALHNGEILALHLSWKDSSQNDSLLTPQAFSDGAAVQFSADQDPPFFGMGAGGVPVTLWHWKAAWQKDAQEREDVETHYSHMAVDYYPAQTNYGHGSPFEARDSKANFHDPLYLTAYGAGNRLADPNRENAAEEARAEGLGTLTGDASRSHEVKARGGYENGRWSVIFIGKLGDFKTGRPLSLAFALWDGEAKDRNGQKMVSIWNELVLEP